MSITIATHDVARLQIEMGHVVLLVHIYQTISNRLNDFYSLGFAYMMLLDIVIEVLPINEVHHIVERAVLTEWIGYTHNVGMVKMAHVDCFFSKFLTVVLRKTTIRHAGNATILTTWVKFLHKELFNRYLLP